MMKGRGIDLSGSRCGLWWTQ